MKNKKSQVAMEFLMNYGWAILIVLIAIGALAYFGMFDIFRPDSCSSCSHVDMDYIIASVREDGILYVECGKTLKSLNPEKTAIESSVIHKLFYCSGNLTLIPVD